MKRLILGVSVLTMSLMVFTSCKKDTKTSLKPGKNSRHNRLRLCYKRQKEGFSVKPFAGQPAGPQHGVYRGW